MKKTLVALAVLAASGASFAQVTITGDVEWGWGAGHNGVTKSDNSGLGVDTNELYIDAVEDLGGGLKIAAHMGLIGLGRNGESSGSGNVQGENTTLSLSGGFGKLDLQTTRNGDYLAGVTALGAAPGLDGNVWGARSYRDQIVYTSPELIPGLKASFYWGEPNFQPDATNDTGMGAGQTGNTKPRRTIISAIYSAGALGANIGFSSFDNQAGTPTSASAKTGVRAGVNYNFGAAVVGAGIDSTNLENGTVTDTALNVNVPVGSFSFGAFIGQRKVSGLVAGATNGAGSVVESVQGAGTGALLAANTDGTKNGWGIGARYNLSKSTAVWWQYKSYDAILNAPEKSTFNEIALAKSF